MTILQANKKLHDGKRMLMVIPEPSNVQGLAYLFLERDNRQMHEYVYLPSIRRARELLNIMAYDSFFTTDITYTDLGFIPIHEAYQLLGEEQYNGVRAYKVKETIPKEKMYYSQITTGQ